MSVLTIANLKEKGLLVSHGESSIVCANRTAEIANAYEVFKWLKANCPRTFLDQLTRQMIADAAPHSQHLNRWLIENSPG